jgi:hypothetical protein
VGVVMVFVVITVLVAKILVINALPKHRRTPRFARTESTIVDFDKKKIDYDCLLWMNIFISVLVGL